MCTICHQLIIPRASRAVWRDLHQLTPKVLFYGVEGEHCYHIVQVMFPLLLTLIGGNHPPLLLAVSHYRKVSYPLL